MLRVTDQNPPAWITLARDIQSINFPTYLYNRIVVDVYDLVQISHNHLGYLQQLVKVVSLVRFHIHVQCD